MQPIPTEARATLAAYRLGRTEAQFLRDMWCRRRVEHPGRVKSTGQWPPTCRTDKGFVLRDPNDNVMPIKRKGQR
ncbi:MAG TPA: hypothetical protein DEQ40_09115 [Oxalobacteraceae bacterium]|jgi:hypothetical protein|nr:hypothetical protein [Oxalobacteraceae bacterium]